MAYTNQQNLDVPIPVTVSGNVTLISGANVTINSISGQGVILPATQVVKVSGEQVVVNYDGAVTTLFSGYPCTNTIVTSGIGFLQYGKATFSFTNTGIGAGSGVNYSVVGFTLSGVISKALASGTIYSGGTEIQTITDPYSWLNVGADNTQDNFSGNITVIVVRK